MDVELAPLLNPNEIVFSWIQPWEQKIPIWVRQANGINKHLRWIDFRAGQKTDRCLHIK